MAAENSSHLHKKSTSESNTGFVLQVSGTIVDVQFHRDKTPDILNELIIAIKDNGTAAVGFVRVKTTGVLEFYATVAGGAFTNSGTKGVNAGSITYTLA